MGSLVVTGSYTTPYTSRDTRMQGTNAVPFHGSEHSMQYYKWKRMGLLLFFLLIVELVAQEVQRDSNRVSWFLHVSDLHFSDDDKSRESDLSTLFRDELSAFDFSAVLFTGDLVHAKRSSYRSEQLHGEWEQYRRVIATVHASLGMANETLIDIRGNHDMFDVPLKDGDRDFYRSHGVQGKNWRGKTVLMHPTFKSGKCPVYCLVGVDLSPDVGLRSPTNFFGRLTNEILHELEAKLIKRMRKWLAEDCSPVYIAYGHYPLSTVGMAARFFVKDQDRLKRMLMKYGISAWLCGHLHDAFGDHLHRLHSGDASNLFELEMTDWKINRRFRIMAVDTGYVSYMDFEWQKTPVNGSHIRALDSDIRLNGTVVMITSPPSPYFVPQGNRKPEHKSTTAIRAIVWPTDTSISTGNLDVSVSFICDDTSEIHHTFPMGAVEGGRVYEVIVDPDMDDTPCDLYSAQVEARIKGTDSISLSEKRQVAHEKGPNDFRHSLLERLVLKYPWYAVFQNLYLSLLLFHVVVMLLVPKFLSFLEAFQSSPVSLDEEPNRRNGSINHWCLRFALAPVRAFVLASRCQIYWWGHLSFSLFLLLGPWWFARVLSDRPLGILFVPTVYVRNTSQGFQSTFSPEMPFRACFYYVSVVIPTTLWIVWMLNRCAAKGNGSGKRHRLVMFLYIIAGLVPLVSLFRFSYTSWQYYGALSVFLSPTLTGWLLLNVTIIVVAIRSIPKCRQE